MIDRFGREINYLRVSVTDRCNLRCVYCMPEEGISVMNHDDILRYEEVLRVVRSSVGLGIVKVRVTGGEPLVRRGVIGFLSSLASLPGLKDLSLTTNGALLGSMADDIFDAGVRRINVSLDSLNSVKYTRITRGGFLGDVLGGLERARRVGFSPIKINVVTIKGLNEDEIIDFARLTIEQPYQVRFIELMPLGQAADEHESRYISNDEVHRRISRYFELEPLERKNKTDGPARIYRLRNGTGEIGLIGSISSHVCRSCNRLRLTADGRLRACLFSESEIDLKRPLRNGCRDDELAGLIKGAVEEKPEGMDRPTGGGRPRRCMREMSSIGG
ncbi:MAG TPA: GTP 3',8-cyclase MoaA [Syntrophales bacterium]|nr:GTP 3',8-cyclase MoaA [Syntrophales bacterium]HRT70182.1 GTP 3',8-cyclase MoaA [Syntrophales bacterium]